MTTTNIEWADRVWNPVTGCTKVSEGCPFCAAFFTRPFDEADYAMDYWCLADGSLERHLC